MTESEYKSLTDSDYRLWRGYHFGRRKNLTESEYNIVRKYDAAVNRLVPTDKLLKIGKNLDNLMNMDIEMLAKKFDVLEDVILFKIQDLIHQRNIQIEQERKNKVKCRIKKRKDNIIFVNFN